MIEFLKRRVIYHPVIARVFYDCVSTISLVVCIIFIFSFFNQYQYNQFSLFLFPLIFLIGNYWLGMYTKYKISLITTKSLVLCISGLLAGILISFFTGFSLPLLLVVFISLILTILPRACFSFKNTASKYAMVRSIIQSTDPLLVVGGGGYIGTMLVEKLLKENYKVRVFDKFVYGKEVFAKMSNIHNLELIQGDISDLYTLTLAVRNTRAVVHLAGIVGDPAAAFDTKVTRHMNIVSTRMLKETAKAFGIPRFIFASSCSVYGNATGVCNENSALNPVSLYAQTKIDAEQELLLDAFDSFHPTVLRFATVFGHSRKPRFDLVTNLFVAQAYTAGVITVTNKQQWRPFIHVQDVANAIFLTLEAPQEKVSRQIFNIGNESLNYTIHEIATMAKQTVSSGRKVQIILKNSENDMRNYRVTFKKVYEVLGFKPQISLEDGMKEIYQEYKKGTYTKPYTDSFYVNSEMIKNIQREFYTKKYQATNFSSIS